MFSLIPFKWKMIAGGSLIALSAFSLTYVHIGSLKDDISVLEAQGKAQELIIEGYSADMEAMLNQRELENKIQAQNKVAQAEISLEVKQLKTKLRRAVDEANDECDSKPLPAGVLDSLLIPTQIHNKD